MLRFCLFCFFWFSEQVLEVFKMGSLDSFDFLVLLGFFDVLLQFCRKRLAKPKNPKNPKTPV